MALCITNLHTYGLPRSKGRIKPRVEQTLHWTKHLQAFSLQQSFFCESLYACFLSVSYEALIIAHCGHTSKGCSTMINPPQLDDIDTTQDVVRVISISPRKCSDTTDEAFFSTNQTTMKAAKLLMPRCTSKPQELLHTYRTQSSLKN